MDLGRCTYGSNALILMPSLAYSPAADSVSPMTPNLLLAYAALCGKPLRPDVLETLTTAPPGLDSLGS